MHESPSTLPTRGEDLMTGTVASLRELFNGADAAEIAKTIDPFLAPMRSGSARFACFHDPGRLLIVAGEQEGRDVELALAYGLEWARGRRLLLALPEQRSNATRQRIPWLRPDARPELWLHDGRGTGRVDERTREQTQESFSAVLKGASADVEFRHAATAHHLGSRAAWVTGLVDWATSNPLLDPAHRQSERSWHHRGQRVLSIQGGRGLRVRAGIHYSDLQRNKPLELAGPLAASDLRDIQAAVDGAISERNAGDDSAIRRDDEHLLQSVLRRNPTVVGIEQQVMREVPAWRPMDDPKEWTRGYIDLVGIDGNGDIVVAETKIEQNNDPLLVLQGLDYVVWAHAYRNALSDRLGAASDARIRLNLVVGACGAAAPRVPTYTHALAAALDGSVLWSARAVHDWAEPAPEPTWQPLVLGA